MSGFAWVTAQLARALHDQVVVQFGGLSGVRDPGLLESALDRPRNLLGYVPESTVFELAASLCVGIAKNHPFNDGNKRTALIATATFLFMNGQWLEAPQAEQVLALVAVAAGSMDEAALAGWLQTNSKPRDL